MTDANLQLEQGRLSTSSFLTIHAMVRISGVLHSDEVPKLHNDQICFTFLEILLKKTASAIHCGLEFLHEPGLGSGQWVADWFGKKSLYCSTQKERINLKSLLWVYCVFFLPEIIKGNPSQGLKAVFYSEMQINAMSFETSPSDDQLFMREKSSYFVTSEKF